MRVRGKEQWLREMVGRMRSACGYETNSHNWIKAVKDNTVSTCSAWWVGWELLNGLLVWEYITDEVGPDDAHTWERKAVLAHPQGNSL